MSTSDIPITRRTVAGLSVAEAGAGAGPPVLFLHGIGSSGDAFEHQFAALADRYHCIAPDAPGYARSADRPIRPPTIATYADIVVDLLDGLGIARAAVLGVSWGGVMATSLAGRHPTRLWALVLADSSRGSGVDPDRATAMRHRYRDLEDLGIETFSERRTPRLVTAGAPPELLHQVARTMAEAVRPAGYADAVESMASTDHTELARTITAPTLVVVGEHDQVTPPDDSQRLAELIPGAELVTIADAGHLANQEQPAAFNEAVAAFLDRHRPG